MSGATRTIWLHRTTIWFDDTTIWLCDATPVCDNGRHGKDFVRSAFAGRLPRDGCAPARAGAAGLVALPVGDLRARYPGGAGAAIAAGAGRRARSGEEQCQPVGAAAGTARMGNTRARCPRQPLAAAPSLGARRADNRADATPHVRATRRAFPPVIGRGTGGAARRSYRVAARPARHELAASFSA